MGAKSITNEQAWLATGLSSSLRVKYMFDPVETNRTVSITRFWASKMPVWRRMSGPRAAMGGRGPDDHRVKGSAIG